MLDTKSCRVYIRVEDWLKSKIEERAGEQKKTVSRYILDLVAEDIALHTDDYSDYAD